MMLEVILSPAELPALAGRDLRNTTCVVFDVLRATSTFVTALHHGAKAVIPVAEISEALAIRQKQPGVLLGGERGGVKIRAGQTGGGDFDLGNSPREYTPEIVRGKTIVSTTTNGTRALRACAGAKTILAASFLNLTATAQFIRQLQPAELLLVCAGTRENMADEDVLAAGALCEILVAPQAASLLTNLVAADVSPRTLSQMNVSADSRRRLRSKGAKREKMLQGEGVQRTGLRGAEVAPATQAGEGFVQMTDSAETARNAWRKAKSNLLEVVSEAENAQRLLAIPELRDDVAFCLQQDVFNLVAVLGRDGAIRVAA